MNCARIYIDSWWLQDKLAENMLNPDFDALEREMAVLHVFDMANAH